MKNVISDISDCSYTNYLVNFIYHFLLAASTVSKFKSINAEIDIFDLAHNVFCKSNTFPLNLFYNLSDYARMFHTIYAEAP